MISTNVVEAPKVEASENEILVVSGKLVNLPKSPKEHARDLVLFKWNESEWDHFVDLVERESGWDNEAQNPDSTAYGIGQFLNGTWETVDCEKTSNSYVQIDCMVKYVALNYETPSNAISYHNLYNSY